MNDEKSMKTSAEVAIEPTAELPSAQADTKKLKGIAHNPVNITKKVFVYFFLVLFALWILVPFYIILVTSFKTPAEIGRARFTWIPLEGITLKGYQEAFSPMNDSSQMTLIRGFFNTLWIIIPPTFIGLMTSAFAAYAFAKLKYRGKNVLFALLLTTMMIPGMVTFVPSYVLYDAIGWTGKPLPLMIPGMFGAAACVFYLRQFFMGIPSETLEAARIDGVGYFGMFFKMMLPLSVPALIAQGVLGFVGGYNDYLGPLLYLRTSGGMETLQVMLYKLQTQYGEHHNTMMAMSVIALVPTVAIYLVAQRYFIEGIAVSGLK